MYILVKGKQVVTFSGTDVTVVTWYADATVVCVKSLVLATAQGLYNDYLEKGFKLRPLVNGVGIDITPERKKRLCAMSFWVRMLGRCYGNTNKHNYSYSDCSVSPEWLHFDVFLVWFNDNYVRGTQLDKDTRVANNRVYSADTCAFISPEANRHEVATRGYTLKHTSGIRCYVPDLKQFALLNNIKYYVYNSVVPTKRLLAGYDIQECGWTTL